MLAIRYSKKTGSSPSGASTLYQATALLQLRAKSAASSVLPEPARPLTMVDVQELKLCLRRARSLGREICARCVGILIFSRISCILLAPGLVQVSITNMGVRGPLLQIIPPLNQTLSVVLGWVLVLLPKLIKSASLRAFRDPEDCIAMTLRNS